MARPKRLTTPLYSLGAKLFVACVGLGEASDYHKRRLTCRTTYLSSLESYWFELNLGIFAKGNYHYATSQPSTWGSQRGALLQCHQRPSKESTTITTTYLKDSQIQAPRDSQYSIHTQKRKSLKKIFF